jgi:hypothetical protein
MKRSKQYLIECHARTFSVLVVIPITKGNKMYFYETLLDLYALHGRDTAVHAAKHMAEGYLDSVTQTQLDDRRAELTTEMLERKKLKEDHTAARLKHEAEKR